MIKQEMLDSFRASIEAPAEFLIRADKDGVFTIPYSNSHSKRLLGMPVVLPEEQPVAWDHLPDIVSDYLRKVFEELGDEENETTLPILEIHDPVHCAFSVKLQRKTLDSEGGREHLFYFSLTEVTEWIGLQEDAMNKRRLESVGALASGVAHDFNNLMMVIRGHVEFLLSPPPSKRTAEMLQFSLEQITQACTNGSAMTATLLGFSRRQSLALEPLDLRELVREVGCLARISYGSRHPVHVDPSLLPAEHGGLPDTEPMVFIGSQAALGQCLLNVLNNARDAMPDGGAIHIEPANDGEFTGITIADHGSGMTPKVLKHIFDPFFTTKQKGSGTGLGLSMAREVMKQHHGDIRVESTPGEGTRVHFLWPARQFHNSHVAAAHPQRSVRTTNVLRTEGILPLAYVIDDDDMVLKSVTQMLHAMSFKTESFQTPGLALTALEEGSKPSLILVDYNMPEIDGINFMRRAYRIMKGFAGSPYAKIVLISGHPPVQFNEFAAEFKDASFHMLHKPFGMEDIEKIVSRENRRRARRTTSQIHIPTEYLRGRR